MAKALMPQFCLPDSPIIEFIDSEECLKKEKSIYTTKKLKVFKCF